MQQRFTMALVTGLILVGAPLAAQAQESGTNGSAIQRFSVQGSVGANLVFPYAATRLSYRLPVADDRIDLFASYAPVNVTLDISQLKVLLMGTRYYYELRGPVRRFAELSVGSLIYAPTFVPGYGVTPWKFGSYSAQAGVGLDWMPWDHLGLSASINAGYPSILRPEVGVKLAW